MLAAYFGSDRETSVLVGRGANLNLGNEEGWTAAMFAACKGHAPSLRDIVGEGADLDRVNSKGHTAAGFAAQWRHDTCSEIIRSAQLARAKNDALASITHERAQPTKRAPSRSP